MTREERAIQILEQRECCMECVADCTCAECDEAFEMAIKALEQKPYEKFESVKDHIYKLAGDYKCWDNRLTQDEAVELCHILEQEPCDLLIIKSHILLHQDDRKKWVESIKREKESGTIILPPYFEPLLVPNDIEISIEQEPKKDVKGGE